MNTRNIGPVAFEVSTNDQIAVVPPVMFLQFPEINTYEVRAHIYQVLCMPASLILVFRIINFIIQRIAIIACYEFIYQELLGNH